MAGEDNKDKKQFNSLEGSKTEEIVKAAPKLTEEEIKKKENKADIQDTINKEGKVEEDGFWDKVGENVAVGKAGMVTAGGSTSYGEGKAIADRAREINEKGKNAMGLSEKDTINFANTMRKVFANPELLEDMNLDAKTKDMIKKMGGVVTAERETEFFQGVTKALKAKREALEALTKNTIFVKSISDGMITPEGVALAGDYAKQMAGEKRTPSRGALDAVQERGATQMDAPEFPEEDKKILAKVLSGAFANIMKGAAIAAAPTDRSAQIGAIMESPGIQIMAGTAPMLASDIAAYKQRVTEVEDKNIMLMEKYNDKVDQLLANYDQDLNAAEREYSTMLFNGRLNRINRVEALYGESVKMQNEIGALEMSKDAVRQGMESRYKTRKQNAEATNARLKAMAIRNVIAEFKAKKANAKANIRDYSGFLAENMAGVSTFSYDMSTGLAAMNAISGWKEMVGPAYGGQQNAPQAVTARRTAESTDKIVRELFTNGQINKQQMRNFDSMFVYRTGVLGESIKKISPQLVLKLIADMPTNANGELNVQATNEGGSGFRDTANQMFRPAFEHDKTGKVKYVDGKSTIHTGWKDVGHKTAENYMLMKSSQNVASEKNAKQNKMYKGDVKVDYDYNIRAALK